MIFFRLFIFILFFRLFILYFFFVYLFLYFFFVYLFLFRGIPGTLGEFAVIAFAE